MLRIDAARAEEQQLRAPWRYAGIDDVGLDLQVVANEIRRVSVVGVDAADLAPPPGTRTPAARGEETLDRRLIAQVELGAGAQQQIRDSPRPAGAARSRCPPGRDGRRRKSRASLFMIAGTCGSLRAPPAHRAAPLRDRPHHFLHQAVEAGLGAASRASARLAGIAEQRLDFRRPEVRGSTLTTTRPVCASTPCSSTPLPRHSICMPSCAPPRSTNSRTECCSPVAITKSSGCCCCSISHCAST